MPTYFRGADLIYKVRARFDDTREIIIISTFTSITATFCLGGVEIEYTLDDSEITIDNNLINIYVQRSDFDSSNQGLWHLKIQTEETDASFADNVRVRKGEILNALRVDEACN